MNVGFISFRFLGIDGVSLETRKWANVLEDLDCNCYFLCGEADTPPDQTMIQEELHFNHPEIVEITEESFARQYRTPALTSALHQKRNKIKNYINEFINAYNINLLIVENVLSIPMNIPLSMALVEVISETQIPTIVHHHDFYWERERYLVNCVQDILQGYFHPNLTFVRHVTINSLAQSQLGYRCGINSTVIPNVMDFETVPRSKDEYGKDIRKSLGISEESVCILQPTRIVQRKGIEHAIEISRRLEQENVLIISHESGDEGSEYKQRILEYADMLGVDLRLTSDAVRNTREMDSQQGKKYDLNDVYNMADLVTYPSLIEGFGNAFLEAVYFNKLLVVNAFPVYVTDIKTKGFQCLEFTNFVSKSLMELIRETLKKPEQIEEMAAHNFAIARRHYSHANLRLQLKNIIVEFLGYS